MNMKLFSGNNQLVVTAVIIAGFCSITAMADSRLYVYPNNGQDNEQISQDRYDCHRWAVHETGFDPTQFDQTAPPDFVVVPKNPKSGATGIGIITGAVIGTVLGSLDDNAGRGAAIGGGAQSIDEVVSHKYGKNHSDVYAKEFTEREHYAKSGNGVGNFAKKVSETSEERLSIY